MPYGNAVEPGFQRATVPEASNSLEGTQKNFLGHIGCIGRIGENAVRKIVNAGVVVSDEPIECGIRTGLEFAYELRFIPHPRQTLR